MRAELRKNSNLRVALFLLVFLGICQFSAAEHTHDSSSAPTKSRDELNPNEIKVNAISKKLGGILNSLSAKDEASFLKKMRYKSMRLFIDENIKPVAANSKESIRKLNRFFKSVGNLPGADLQERINRLIRLFPDAYSGGNPVSFDGTFKGKEAKKFLNAKFPSRGATQFPSCDPTRFP